MNRRWPIAREALEAFRDHQTLPRQLSWFFLNLCEPRDLWTLNTIYTVLLQGSEPGSKERVKIRYRLKMIQIRLDHLKK